MNTTSAPLPFAGATARWFERVFPAPTPAQTQAWESILTGAHTLVVAPTGSGKTLAAFLAAIDRLAREPEPPAERRCRVLYVSPLKALAADVERNLRAPLIGIGQEAQRSGLPAPQIRVGTRTGDTPAHERRTFATSPPDILITTPESLFLMLTSGARAGFAGVDTVIIDEIHALAGTKRGAHLALSLERLDALLPAPAQRIGLSATVEPPARVARFLAGHRAGRPLTVVRPPAQKVVDIQIDVPARHFTPSLEPSDQDLAGPATRTSATPSIWPGLTSRVVDLIESHSSVIVFTNSRRTAERLTSRINEEATTRAGEERVLARAHHGSMSRGEREDIETALKSGVLPAVVATSSLELGIDMGAVDLVVQVGSPPSVASTLQRVGRAGHQVGAPSRGVLLPLHAGDLLAGAMTSLRAGDGLIEALHPPQNPLDVLAQHIVAIASMDDVTVTDLADLVRRADPFHTLSQDLLESVLEMLSGRYPSEEFAELRPRISWDRINGVLTGLPGSARLAVTSGGTIPDRGLYGVFIVGEGAGRRVGELDEEMVHESRVGDLFTLGSTTWRIEEITPDQVRVSPAPGAPGKLPFWRGDSPARPVELGRAFGATLRDVESRLGEQNPLEGWGLSEDARVTLLEHLREQARTTGVLPTDRRIVVEQFRDEIGDWRLVVHSPFGARVHSPWVQVISAGLRDRGIEVSAMVGDDGFVLRLPDTGDPFDPLATGNAQSSLGISELVLDPEDLTARVVSTLAGSAHFAARFREAAARALLLPRRRPDRRQPLWQQRLRSAHLLEVASRFPEFPIMIEAARECVQDDFDVPALADLMTAIRARHIHLVEVTPATPSPFAKSLMFGYAAQFLYDGDSPLAERRAAALSLDPGLLADVLGEEMSVADLLDPGALASVEAEVSRRAYPLTTPEQLVDLVRRLGPLSLSAARERAAADAPVEEWFADLVAARRVFPLRVAGAQAWAVMEDAARLRDGLGIALPVGIPEPLLTPVADPLGDLVRRYARHHGPFRAVQVADHYGLPVGAVAPVLDALVAAGALVSGTLRPAETRPPGGGSDYCDAEVLRRIRRRSIAALRAEVEPVSGAAYALFLGAWQGIDTPASRSELAGVLEPLAGAPIAARALESLILPARIPDYRPADLDALLSAGDVVWVGVREGQGDAWVQILPSDAVADLAPLPAPVTGLAAQVLGLMEPGAGHFARDLAGLVDAAPTDLTEALWDLVWAGHISGDTLSPLRARFAGNRPGGSSTAAPQVRRARRSLRAEYAHRSGFGPAAAGRWSRLPERSDPDRRALAASLALIDRGGVAVRGSTPEDLPGGFSSVYGVLSQVEQTGALRRGYFIEGLGAAQFSLTDTVDRLRVAARRLEEAGEPLIHVLAASDPANPYGAALPWPEREGHRPGRKLGATVALVNGSLALYLERGARTLLTYGPQHAVGAAIRALADITRGGGLGRYFLTRINGQEALSSPLAPELKAAGFNAHPRGLRLEPHA